MGVNQIERLVFVTLTDPSRHDQFAHTYREYFDFRNEVKSVQSLAAYRLSSVNVSDSTGLPERYSCVQMTASGFSVAGTKPLLGRDFTAGDERPDASPVLILAYRVWQDRYGKDPGILGKAIRVDGVPRAVIGVMPRKMQFPEDTDLWTPVCRLNPIGAEFLSKSGCRVDITASGCSGY